MKASLVKSITQFEESADVKVIVILSKVRKAFCAGANIKEFENKSSADFVNNDVFKEIHDTLYNTTKPIIAGVNGVALGGGCELSLLCDIAFCSEEAKFGLP
jgi:enoyl-CoA hydratase/carnithine racemase